MLTFDLPTSVFSEALWRVVHGSIRDVVQDNRLSCFCFVFSFTRNMFLKHQWTGFLITAERQLKGDAARSKLFREKTRWSWRLPIHHNTANITRTRVALGLCPWDINIYIFFGLFCSPPVFPTAWRHEVWSEPWAGRIYKPGHVMRDENSKQKAVLKIALHRSWIKLPWSCLDCEYKKLVSLSSRKQQINRNRKSEDG